jgi:transcription antitermination factor NusG
MAKPCSLRPRSQVESPKRLFQSSLRKRQVALKLTDCANARFVSSSESSAQQFQLDSFPVSASSDERAWFAVFTTPQHEQSVARHFAVYAIEHFLPTFESTSIWKNRQRKTIVRPVFPSYVFVQVSKKERGIIFRVPGVLRIVGDKQGPIAIPANEIEFLQTMAFSNRLKPTGEIALGERVRIKNGPMKGAEGTLVRQNNSMKFVLTVELIHQQVAIEVGAGDIESVCQ